MDWHKSTELGRFVSPVKLKYVAHFLLNCIYSVRQAAAKHCTDGPPSIGQDRSQAALLILQ